MAATVAVLRGSIHKCGICIGHVQRVCLHVCVCACVRACMLYTRGIQWVLLGAQLTIVSFYGKGNVVFH